MLLHLDDQDAGMKKNLGDLRCAVSLAVDDSSNAIFQEDQFVCELVWGKRVV